jgi:hypothetical protein
VGVFCRRYKWTTPAFLVKCGIFIVDEEGRSAFETLRKGDSEFGKKHQFDVTPEDGMESVDCSICET